MKRRAFWPCRRFSQQPRDRREDRELTSRSRISARTPYKFGGKEVDRVTMLNVKCRAVGARREIGGGGAAMSMGNVWSFRPGR
jgi:hypothetical protein